jgi:membrane protein implicated in regulation of membrane protease activity
VRRLGTLLMLAGVALWLLGVCAWISGVWISLSPAAAKVYLLTLAGFTGALLLAAGAAVSRLQKPRPVDERESRPPAGVR